MTALNKQALRKLAKVLSGQEWVAFVHKASGTYAVGSLGHERGEDIIKWPGFDGQDNAESKAKFIAAASPAAMLEFLDELEAEKNMREAAEKRIAELEARDINIKRQAQALFEAIANPNDCYIPAYVRCLREALNGNSTSIGVKGE
ncbi:TPA: ead/Ea22-like family protein [Citrobacter freundii]|nr:ead/Ea22-like family protein [Citrobacter freundii]HED3524053.1 ead/Ea22-like family protein [Citrobacter freundii]HED3529082.1 ead/Ea22-like family protein [Citrobacter freundii]HED3597674.1 ead/Ea22-like family protein [Citrobacter freundii]